MVADITVKRAPGMRLRQGLKPGHPETRTSTFLAIVGARKNFNPMRFRLPVLMALALAGCSSATERESSASDPKNPLSSATGSESRGSVPVRPVLHEHSSGVVDSTRSVITDNTAFSALWAQAFRFVSEAPPVPTIDFTREMLIAASLGTRPSGGYSITVDSVTSGGSELAIFVSAIAPGSTCAVTGALTHPVVIVAIPRTAGVPRFMESAARRSC
jgi:hypothetical protein